MRIAVALILMAAGAQVDAQIILASRTVRAQQVITLDDLQIVEGDDPQGVGNPDMLIGREAKKALYAGRPVRLGDTRPPALVERNAPIKLHYVSAGLTIVTEGRSLDRAAAGEWIRVMNISSRTTVTAFIAADAIAYVRP